MITTCADDTFRKKQLNYKTKNLPSVVTRSNTELFLMKNTNFSHQSTIAQLVASWPAVIRVAGSNHQCFDFFFFVSSLKDASSIPPENNNFVSPPPCPFNGFSFNN